MPPLKRMDHVPLSPPSHTLLPSLGSFRLEGRGVS